MTTRLPKAVRAFFSQMGRKGGRIGGKKSLITMTPEQRRARAQKAGLASVAARRKKKAARTKPT